MASACSSRTANLITTEHLDITDDFRDGDALGYYHERRDADRNVGLGPEHSWASHAADSFGLMAICYEEPSRVAGFGRKLNYPKLGIA